MRSNFVRENPRHVDITVYDATMLQERFEAASRRADKSAVEMIAIIEDEIAENRAFESAFRAQHQRLRWDDDG